MPISLYTATVGPFLQILPPIAALVDKAEDHCKANGLPDEALTDCRLAEDMWNFAKQVSQCSHHSARAIEGVRAGTFSPEPAPAPLDFASLRAEIAASIALLEAVDPAEIDGMIGRDMRFEFKDIRLDFTVEDFLLSFTLPNFFFHATTAYGILRNQGLPVGKMDFMGTLRLKA